MERRSRARQGWVKRRRRRAAADAAAAPPPPPSCVRSLQRSARAPPRHPPLTVVGVDQGYHQEEGLALHGLLQDPLQRALVARLGRARRLHEALVVERGGAARLRQRLVGAAVGVVPAAGVGSGGGGFRELSPARAGRRGEPRRGARPREGARRGRAGQPAKPHCWPWPSRPHQTPHQAANRKLTASSRTSRRLRTTRCSRG
jgi:hypothetical protein